MNRAIVTDRLWDKGWKSPRTPPEFWTRNGETSYTSSVQDVGQRSAEFPEERGLTLASPGRLRTLLVPLDGGPFGEHALPHALAIARRTGAAVRLVHVHSEGEALHSLGIPSATELRLSQKRHWKSYLDDLFRRLARVSSVPMTPVLVEGRNVVDTLRAEANDGIDLVVMATHGRSLLGRLCRGSITSTLMRRLSVPLLLVRGQDTLPELSIEPSIRNVLLPLDGTRDAEQGAVSAMALGSLWDAHYTLLRIIRWKFDYSVGYVGVSSRSSIAAQREEAWDYLRRVSDRLKAHSHRIRSRTLYTDESVARAILCYAQRHGADLIAMTKRSRGGLARLLRGSVTNRVIRRATMSVLVLPSNLEKGQG